jgi:hypothetical protein
MQDAPVTNPEIRTTEIQTGAAGDIIVSEGMIQTSCIEVMAVF